MTIATILAVLEGTDTSDSALSAALSLGKRFSARVDVLHVEADAGAAVPIVGEGMSGAAVEQILASLQEQAAARSKAARELFDSRAAQAKLTVVKPDAAIAPGKHEVSYRHVVGREDEMIVRYGRLVDVIVTARPEDGGDAETSVAFDAALFDSGRPVLLTPSEPVSSIGETVAVAWNRSRESARAISGAMPILRKAQKVIILTGREDDDGPEPSELAHYLAGHAIEPKNWAFTPGPGSIGDSLLAEAQKAGADLLVMGAYGHSRLRELVLGGATRGVLSRGAIPVLLVH